MPVYLTVDHRCFTPKLTTQARQDPGLAPPYAAQASTASVAARAGMLAGLLAGDRAGTPGGVSHAD